MRNCYVIYTATILPTAGALLASNSGVREEEYITAIRTNMALARKTGISAQYILAENSIADAAKLKKACLGEGVRFVRCPGVESQDFKGKGHSEALMIKYVIDTITPEQTDCVFLKVTGRLRIINIGKILHAVALSSADSQINLYAKSFYADTRVMAFTGPFWAQLMQFMNLVDDDSRQYLEHVVPLAIRAAGLNGLKCSYLAPPPLVSGRSGSTGRLYKPTLPGHWIQYIKLIFKTWIYPQSRD